MKEFKAVANSSLPPFQSHCPTLQAFFSVSTALKADQHPSRTKSKIQSKQTLHPERELVILVSSITIQPVCCPKHPSLPTHAPHLVAPSIHSSPYLQLSLKRGYRSTSPFSYCSAFARSPHTSLRYRFVCVNLESLTEDGLSLGGSN